MTLLLKISIKMLFVACGVECKEKFFLWIQRCVMCMRSIEYFWSLSFRPLNVIASISVLVLNLVCIYNGLYMATKSQNVDKILIQHFYNTNSSLCANARNI